MSPLPAEDLYPSEDLYPELPEPKMILNGLDLMDETLGFGVNDYSFPAPKQRPVYASSIDTEGADLVGEPSYENRQLSLVLEVLGEEPLGVLQAVVAHIGREGGTLTWITPGGRTVTYDLLTFDSYEPDFGLAFSIADLSEVTLTLPARPFGRGEEIALDLHTETTLPALVFTEDEIPGDMPALGRLVIDEDQGVDQAWMVWGVRSRRYSADPSAALLIQAETLTVLGGSSKVAGPTGASGSGNNVVRNTDLTTSWVSILSGRLSATSTYLSHVGTFRVFARVYCPVVFTHAAATEVALEWAEGDFRRVTRNRATPFNEEWGGSWRILDLGLVSLREVAQGVQRWEPRIVARAASTGDEIDVDWLMLIPVDEAAGEVASVTQTASLTGFEARDDFATAAGALTGKTLPVGGTWAGAGDSDDFAVTGFGTMQRTAVSDAGSTLAGGRFVRASGTTALTTSTVQVDVTGGPCQQAGVLLRYVDANNFLAATVSRVDHQLSIWMVVGGVVAASWSTSLPSDADPSDRIRAQVSAGGVVTAWRFTISAAVTPTHTVQGYHSALAIGGALASGAVGIVDWYALASPAATRTFDNFHAWVPSLDAAVFASQALEVRHDQVIRQDSAGEIWTPVSSYEGDYARLPVSGPDSRPLETIVKFSRNVPGQGADSGIDDLSAKWIVTPRYLTVPS